MEIYVLLRKDSETGEYQFVRSGGSSIKVFITEGKALGTAKAFFGFNSETDKIAKYIPA